jgi:hypothetical protein
MVGLIIKDDLLALTGVGRFNGEGYLKILAGRRATELPRRLLETT